MGSGCPGLRGPLAGLGDCPSSPCPCPSWALGKQQAFRGLCAGQSSLIGWILEGVGGGYLDGAGLAPAGQCSDNVDELGNDYLSLSYLSLYLNMLEISVVKSYFVAIF